jgi:hypothetical protein
MVEWTPGLLLVLILVIGILEVFDLIDLFKLIAGAARLIARVLFAMGDFFICLISRRGKDSANSDRLASRLFTTRL